MSTRTHAWKNKYGPWPKLTPGLRREIQALRLEGLTLDELAKEFGLSRSTIQSAVNNKYKTEEDKCNS